MSRILTVTQATVLAASAVILPSQGYASGFQLLEQDAAGAGDYYSGVAAEANSASTAYFNPAGLTRLKTRQAVLGGAGIFTSAKFTGKQTIEFPGIPLPPVTESGSAKGGGFNFVPNFHIALPYNERTVFGFSVSVPFGLSTDWPTNSVVRHAATLSKLQTLNFSPSIGYKVSDRFSVGFGVDAQRLSIALDEAVAFPAVLALPELISRNRGSSWGYGFHTGLLYEFNDHSRVGLAYRSRVHHNISGSSVLDVSTTGKPFAPTQGALKSSLNLPASTTLSMYHGLNQQWSLLGSIVYTQWSSIDRLSIDNVLVPTTTVPKPINIDQVMDYKNTWRFAVGTHYQFRDDMTLRLGFGYDQTPTNDAHRDVRLPGGDRYAVALGGHYQASKSVGFDLGWTHLFIHNGDINHSISLGDDITEDAITVGTVRNDADVVAFQVNWDIL